MPVCCVYGCFGELTNKITITIAIRITTFPFCYRLFCKVELLHSRHRIKMAAAYRVRVRD